MTVIHIPQALLRLAVLVAVVVVVKAERFQNGDQICHLYQKGPTRKFNDDAFVLPQADPRRFGDWGRYNEPQGYKAHLIGTSTRQIQIVAGSQASPRSVFEIRSLQESIFYTLNANDQCSVDVPFRDGYDAIEKVLVHKVADY